MKMVIVILGGGAADAALRGLVEAGFRVTKVASSGGFLRRGNTTLFMGMESSRIEAAFAVVRQALADTGEPRATAFVLQVARHEQL